MNETNGCILPIVQGVVMGLLAGLLALAVAMLLSWSAPGWVALGVGACAALSMFYGGVSAWRRVEFRELYISPPTTQSPQVQSVKVELHQPLDGGARQTQLFDLPVSYDQLKELADGVMRGAPLSEATWSGPGRPFTRAEFAALRGELLRRGWCDWRRADSPGQGCVLTPPGKAVMRSFSSTVSLPSRAGDD